VPTKAMSKSGLKSLVGAKVYSVWTEMLEILVPDGRTHRLAPLVAGMLQYASAIAFEKYGDSPPEDSLAYSLLFVEEGEDSDDASATLLEAIDVMFRDANVGSQRVSSRGEEYSIAQAALAEFVNWHSMPWE
jgi:hypothetical protein